MIPPSPALCASFRTAAPAQLAQALAAARRHTLALFDCFAAAGMDAPVRVPRLDIVNPPLWELGHIAWFAEWFILRGAATSDPADARRGSPLDNGDAWFDSANVPHDSRWTLAMPGPDAIRAYCDAVLERVLDTLSHAEDTDAALYPYRLALAHEDMHGEALLYTLQTFGLAPPADSACAPAPAGAPQQLGFAGGVRQCGSDAGGGFIFDNERGAHACAVAPFTIDSALVSNAQYADFIDDGGYRRRPLWSAAGAAWLEQGARSAPRYWRRDAGGWAAVRFGSPSTLAPAEPVRHLNLFEAQAYCAWAGRRLPTEQEWEHAATSGDPRFQWGQLWEWTASPFAPYPGFSADAYREYSQPWFHTHQVLRGASFATPARLRSTAFRNFYTAERDDIFAGFRTCAST